MSYHTEDQARATGEKHLAAMTPHQEDWDVQVSQNSGWHWALTHKRVPLRVCPNRAYGEIISYTAFFNGPQPQAVGRALTPLEAATRAVDKKRSYARELLGVLANV